MDLATQFGITPNWMGAFFMAYDVHIFTLVEVKMAGIDAATPIDAIARAKESVDFGVLFGHRGFDWGEDHACYVIDTTDDQGKAQREWFLDAGHVEFVTKMVADGIHQA